MSKKIYPILMAGLLAVVSCVRIDEDPVDNLTNYQGDIVSLVAKHENDDTRTVRQTNGAIYWNPSESIRLFYGTTSSKFTSSNTAPAATATFSGSLGGYQFKTGENVWAVYPYSDDDVFDGNKVTLSVPNKQIATAGSFDPSAFPCIAKSSSFELTFKNLCGGIKFRLSKPGVKKVTFRGTHSEPLAGRVVVSLDNAGIPVVSEMEQSYSELSLSAPEGETFKTGTWYHMVSLPASLSAGYTMTIIYDNNQRDIVKSDKAVEIKRCVFGTLTDIDKKASIHQDPAGGTEYGLYLGIIGFNTQLFYYPISLLKEKTKSKFFAFIDGLAQDYDTMLYYSVKESIRTLQVANYPDNLYSASIVTFTDGVDNVSPFYEQYQGTSLSYLEDVNHRLYEEDVAGIPLSAWTVGLWSKDAKSQPQVFENNLQMLSKPSSQVAYANNMTEVNARFEDIASALNNSFYLYKVGIRIAGPANGEKVRFTLDGVTAGEYSTKYIEGVFDMNNLSLYDVHYHGIACNSGATVQGTRENNRVSFQFSGIQTNDNTAIYENRFMEWRWIEYAGVWQRDSEFKPDQAVTIQKERKSAVVLLNLDCTMSLTSEEGDLFPQLKSAAKNFISRLCEMAADPERVASVTLSSGTLNLTVGNGSRLYATVLPETALDKSVRWSTSNSSVATVTSDGYVQAVGPGNAFITVTTNDEECTATCAVAVSKINVTSVTLDKTDLWMKPGGTYTLKATVSPNNASYKDITYTSSNTSVAVVNSSGVVTAVAPGTATIKAASTDNPSKWASCSVTVSYAPQNAVDLGLSVKWAPFNVGASNPEDYGDYYAWGETEPKSKYSWVTYKWCNGSYNSLTKYNTSSSYGTVDNKTCLDLSDDAARANWGGSWRMPTDAELTELLTRCTWTWTTQGGKNGYEVKGPNGNAIFLPAAGNYNGTNHGNTGSYGSYWSSSSDTSGSLNARFELFNSSSVEMVSTSRYYGLPVRPVYGEFIAVSSIRISSTSTNLEVGKSIQLTASVTPSNATDLSIHWASSNDGIATVSSSGMVTAKGLGTATITAYSSNGLSATCTITVLPPEPVDLGLSVKWAPFNVGATYPEDYGDYFAWGETQPKSDYTWATYKWCNGSKNTLIKYNTMSSYGAVDNKAVLDMTDDPARANWGGSWRLPSVSECGELRTLCTWTWTTQGGKNGYKVTGPNGNSIFLPAAGIRDGTGLDSEGSYGIYWANYLFTQVPCDSHAVGFRSDRVDWTGYYRYQGQSVRPVTK